MKRLSALAVIACILFIWNPGNTAQNTSTPGQTPDKRLEQKVNIKATGMPLGDFLMKLSATTGVKMTARKDVADDKLAIYVKDLPLSDLQDAVKEVLHLHYTRKGEKDKWEYEFWMDLKTKQEIDQFKETEVKKLQDYMQKQVSDRKLSPKELAIKYQDKEWLSENRNDLWRISALGIYGGLSKQQLDSLWRGETLEFDKNILPPDVRALIIAKMNRVDEESNSMDEDRGHSGKYIGSGEITGIQWQFKYSPVSGEPLLDYSLLVTHLFKQPDGTISSHGGVAGMSFQLSGNEDANGILQSTETAENGAAPDKNIKIESKTPIVRYKLLAKIAEQADVDIVSDYFTYLASQEIHMYSSNEPRMVSDWILYAIRDRMYTPKITTKSDLYMLSYIKWPALRNREIPERLATRWREILKKQGYLGINEALEINRLSEPQISDLYLYGLEPGFFILQERKLFTFLDSFTPQQWTQVFSEDGLLISALNEDQYRLLQEFAQSNDRAAFVFRNEAYERPDVNALKFDFKAIKLEKKPNAGTFNGHRCDSWEFGVIRNNGTKTRTSFFSDMWPNKELEKNTSANVEEIIELSKPLEK